MPVTERLQKLPTSDVVRAHLGAGPHRLDQRPHRDYATEPRRLAQRHRHDGVAGRRPQALRRRGARRRHRARDRARHGRLQPGAGGVLQGLRLRAGLPAPQRAGHYGPRRGYRADAGRRPAEDAVHRRQQVRHHAGDDLAPRLLLGPHPGRQALRSDHGPGYRTRGHGARARLPARLPGAGQHRRALLGAVALRAGTRGADRHRRRRPCWTAPAGCSRRVETRWTRRRTPARTSAPSSARPRCTGRTS